MNQGIGYGDIAKELNAMVELMADLKARVQSLALTHEGGFHSKLFPDREFSAGDFAYRHGKSKGWAFQKINQALTAGEIEQVREIKAGRGRPTHMGTSANCFSEPCWGLRNVFLCFVGHGLAFRC